MTLTDAANLLRELRQRGVELEVVGDRLRFRPPEAVLPELRQRIVACKPALLAILHEEALVAEAGDGGSPSVVRCRFCRERDFVRPRVGGAWRCARCRPYDLPGLEIGWWPKFEASFVSLDVLLGLDRSARTSHTGACSCCRSTLWWRLKPNGPWTCLRCHPPLPPTEEIEKATIGEVLP